MGTPEGSWVSMGVYSDGSYGQPEGLIYSFPVTCKDGKWSIVQVSQGLLCVLVVFSGVVYCQGCLFELFERYCQVLVAISRVSVTALLSHARMASGA
jgi:hypothetical protein